MIGVRGPRGLLLPDGSTHSTEEKDIIALNPRDVGMLSWLHEWAHNQQVNIFCKRCEQPIRGQNNDTPGQRYVSVTCQCREWRFTQ